MARVCVYKMRFDGDEVIGTARECANASGYCLKTIGMIARGEVNPREGVSVEEIGISGSGNRSDWRRDIKLMEEWDKTVSRFKNVEWVRKDSEEGLKLELSRGNGYRTFSS